MSSWRQKSTTHSPIHALSHTHTYMYTHLTSACKRTYAEYGLFYRIQHSTVRTAWLNDYLTYFHDAESFYLDTSAKWLGILSKIWIWHLKNINVQQHSNFRHYTRSTKMFQDMQTHIQTGCNKTTLLPNMLHVASVHMCGKRMYIATCLSCGSAAWVKVCPSCLARCLCVSSEPVRGSCAR